MMLEGDWSEEHFETLKVKEGRGRWTVIGNQVDSAIMEETKKKKRKPKTSDEVCTTRELASLYAFLLHLACGPSLVAAL